MFKQGLIISTIQVLVAYSAVGIGSAGLRESCKRERLKTV